MLQSIDYKSARKILKRLTNSLHDIEESHKAPDYVYAVFKQKRSATYYRIRPDSELLKALEKVFSAVGVENCLKNRDRIYWRMQETSKFKLFWHFPENQCYDFDEWIETRVPVCHCIYQMKIYRNGQKRFSIIQHPVSSYVNYLDFLKTKVDAARSVRWILKRSKLNDPEGYRRITEHKF